MKTCRRGHSYSGDENYRARQGKCPVCFREVQNLYNRTEKGNARKTRYKQSPKGWLQALADRRACAMRRRANRVTDQGGRRP